MIATLFKAKPGTAGDATLRSDLLKVVASEKMTSLGAYRIGYKDDNEPTILVTVKPDSMAPGEA